MVNRKPELLVPAGSLEVLKTAVRYGADAVYIGGEAFSLRAKAKNFTHDEMAEGIRYAHDHGVKVHVTANIFAHNYDVDPAAEYFRELKELRPDAILIADPGLFTLEREICPEIPVHISTQANNTNYKTFEFWRRLGAERVVCARELSIEEIRELRSRVPSDMDIECFVHGAMCISYSGRCLLSSYMTGRSANRGECTHPCRGNML
jgi:putative protease